MFAKLLIPFAKRIDILLAADQHVCPFGRDNYVSILFFLGSIKERGKFPPFDDWLQWAG